MIGQLRTAAGRTGLPTSAFRLLWPVLLYSLAGQAPSARVNACDLCAIYNSDSARDGGGTGWVATISESWIPYHTLRFNGEELSNRGQDWRESSVTHLVPGYNFSPRFAVSLNVPLVYQSFRRSETRYQPAGPPVFHREQGDSLDLGDVSLVGRLNIFRRAEMEYSLSADLLGGVRFPTGDSDRIADEVSQTRIFDRFVPPGTPHDPLGHSASGVHQHDLSPGSGSFDGIFGVTFRARRQRLFCNGQFQYYLRTEGRATFQYGDELMVSGGPGAFVLLTARYTVSLQANVSYDSMARDRLLGRISNRTGSTAWYLGPQVGASVGQQLSLVAGIDLPCHVTNNGVQNTPDYRLHASLAWRF